MRKLYIYKWDVGNLLYKYSLVWLIYTFQLTSFTISANYVLFGVLGLRKNFGALWVELYTHTHTHAQIEEIQLQGFLKNLFPEIRKIKQKHHKVKWPVK